MFSNDATTTADQKYGEEALKKFLATPLLEEKIEALVTDAVSQVYGQEKWEDDFKKSSEILDRPWLTEGMYEALYEHLETYPSAAQILVQKELEKIGCVWLQHTSDSGENAIYAFESRDTSGELTGDFYGETIDLKGSEHDGYKYGLITPDDLAKDWTALICEYFDALRWRFA